MRSQFGCVDEVLKAQEISLSDCTDESCAIQIGMIPSAEQIVIGDLSDVGARMAFNLKLLDVAISKTDRRKGHLPCQGRQRVG